MLHPLPADYSKSAGANGLSCVLRVDASQMADSKMAHDRNLGSALLVGDIEAPQELALLQGLALQPVGVLLVPHHGSQTSSTSGFIEALMPQWAVVQAGYRNRYGHPAPRVVQRYESLGVPLSISSECGAAHWQSHKPEQLHCEREVRRRYWHTPRRVEPRGAD